MFRTERPAGKYDTRTAYFWGSFPEEWGYQKHQVATLALYENTDREWFVVRSGHGAAPKTAAPHDTRDLPGTQADVFERREDVWPWVEKRLAGLRNSVK